MQKKHVFFCMLVLLVSASVVSAQTVGIFDKQVDWAGRGSLKAPGSASLASGVYTVSGNGDDIWDAQDEGFFLYTEKEGSWSLSAKIEWIENDSSEWSKAGVMIRENASAIGSRHFWPALRGNNFGDWFSAQWRTTTGGSSSNTDHNADPGPWFRVTRVVPTRQFIIETSTDGTTWTVTDTQTYNADWAAKVAYGLAVTNHQDNENLGVANFSDVKLEQFVSVIGVRTLTGAGYFGEPSAFKNGDTLSVSIKLNNPGASAQTAAVVETLPTGWVASDMSDGGTTASGKVNFSVSIPAGGEKVLTYKVKAPAAAGASATFAGTVNGMGISGTSIAIQPGPAVGVFDGSMDIGAVDKAGNASYTTSTKTYSVEGSGADIWNNADEFHYAFSEVKGPVRIKANVEVDSFESTNEWVKAGVMFRDTLTAESTHYFLMSRPDYQSEVQFRAATAGASGEGSLAGDAAGLTTDWDGVLEILYDGQTCRSYLVMADGRVQFHSKAIPMTGSNYIGLAVTSHEDGSLASGLFTNVQVTEYDAYATRSLNPAVNPTDGVTPVVVTVTAHVTPGMTATSTITDTVTSGVTVKNAQASNGTATVSGTTVTWKLNGATADATLTYEVVVPASMVKTAVAFTGTLADLPITGEGMLLPLNFQVPFKAAEATLDGVLSAGEWDGAYKESFSHAEGDGTAPGVHISGNAYPADQEAATFHIYHSNAYIYVAVDVLDKVALDFEGNATDDWQNDSVEMYMDGNLNRQSTKENGKYGFQLTVVGSGLRASGNDAPAEVALPGGGGGSNNAGTYWDYGAKPKADGYVVEYRVKKAEILDPPTRKVIGFDILMNSAEGTGSRTGKWGYWDTPVGGYASGAAVGEYWNDETGWAVVELIGGPQSVSDWSTF